MKIREKILGIALVGFVLSSTVFNASSTSIFIDGKDGKENLFKRIVTSKAVWGGLILLATATGVGAYFIVPEFLKRNKLDKVRDDAVNCLGSSDYVCSIHVSTFINVKKISENSSLISLNKDIYHTRFGLKPNDSRENITLVIEVGYSYKNFCPIKLLENDNRFKEWSITSGGSW